MRIYSCILGTTLLLAGACGDDECGPAAESQEQIAATLGSDSVEWTNWRSSPNNDCGETGGPTSLTVEADQLSTGRGLTLCLPRPDKLSKSPVDVTDTSRIRIIDIFADLAPDCLVALDRGTPASGQVAFPGICGDGQGSEGYSIDFDVSVPVTITCGADVRSELMVLSDIASVQATTLP